MGLSDRLKKFDNVNEYEPASDRIETFEEDSDFDFGDFIMESLSKKAASVPVWFEYDYDKKLELVMSFLDNKLTSEFEGLVLSDEDKKTIAKEFLKTNYGFGILDRVLAKENVSAVTVNSSGVVYAKSHDGFKKTSYTITKEQLEALIKTFNAETPVAKSKRNDFRVTILRPPVCLDTLIIRKIKNISDNLDILTKKSIINPELEYFLKTVLSERKNLLISSVNDEDLCWFIQVLLNSVSDDARCAMLEDNGLFPDTSENVALFSAQQIEDFDYEYLISTVEDLDFDFSASQINDLKKFSSYYLKQENSKSGLLTGMHAQTPADAASKIITSTTASLKCTEKQAKTKLSSIYDYAIHIEKFEDTYRIASIMEITSTKSSSLVMNELVRFVDGEYFLDLPEAYQQASQISEMEEAPLSDSFHARLKEL